MFFMGAAFLLVETKNISQLAILFGATWVTNAVVFVSVFVVAILANLLVSRKTMPTLTVLYACVGIRSMALVAIFIYGASWLAHIAQRRGAEVSPWASL